MEGGGVRGSSSLGQTVREGVTQLGILDTLTGDHVGSSIVWDLHF